MDAATRGTPLDAAAGVAGLESDPHQEMREMLAALGQRSTARPESVDAVWVLVLKGWLPVLLGLIGNPAASTVSTGL